MKEFLFKLDIIAPAVSLLLILIILLIRKRTLPFSDYILIIFFSVELMLNCVAAVLQSKQLSNLWVYFLNCFVIHMLLSYYFLKILHKKQIVYWGFFLFIIVLFVFVKIQPYNTFPSYLYSITSFITVIYSLSFLNQIIDTLPTFEILSLKEFWILTGTLTYFGSTFFIFITYNYLSDISPKNVYILWQLHNIFLCLGCIIFFKAINCNKWILK